jgi:hypothetical protein
MDIQINKFKDYKVVNNPKSSQIIDGSINGEWWDAEGWSSMYDMSAKEFKKHLPDWSRDISQITSQLEFKQPSETSNKLQGVFDFLEKKEGRENPLKAEEESNEIFSDPKALYAGKKGFGWINDKGNVEVFPYPASGNTMEEEGELKFYITGFKDGGVAVWNDALEQEQSGLDVVM